MSDIKILMVPPGRMGDGEVRRTYGRMTVRGGFRYVPIEEPVYVMTLGPISEKSYLRQQLGLEVGKTYAVVEIGDTDG